MAFGAAIYNLIPDVGYEAVHAIEILLGLFVFFMVWKMGEKYRKFAYAVGLYALTGVVWLLTHGSFQVFDFSFSHLVTRVLLLVAVILFFLGMKEMK